MKKTLILTILAMLGIFQSMAQEYEYVPFVREGVKWEYYIEDYNYHVDFYTNPARGDNKAYRTLELKGDTVINGQTYKAVHLYSGEGIDEDNDSIPLYLREENKKVYGIIPNGVDYDHCRVVNYLDWVLYGHNRYYSGEEFLLYDFQDPVAYWQSFLDSINNNIADDEFSFYNYNHLFTDTIAIGNRLAKRYVGTLWAEYQTIEGIGLIGHDSTPFRLFMPIIPGVNYEVFGLEKVVENGEVIYPQNYVEDKYMPLIREGVKWVNERVTVNDGDTTCCYYTYEFKGNHPVTGRYGLQRKALYRYDGLNHLLDVEQDSLVAGLRENEGQVSYVCNEPLNDAISQGRDMINFRGPSEYSEYMLYAMRTSSNGWLFCKGYFTDQQREPFLNDDNFVKAEPVMIDGYRCSRLAYLNEQGDTLAYVVEGIGFDSYEMGDLLTPFTQKPDPDDELQEWCGLSHVVKNGEIIYKGMRYRDGAFDGIDEVVADKTRRPYDPQYYNLMGQPVGKEVPTTPGIYIHNGKKICVR